MNLYSTVEERISSFRQWPNDVVPKESLARAGFWHKGPGLNVKCFACNVEISDWQEGDDPKVKHLRVSPECPHVQRLLSSGESCNQNTGGLPGGASNVQEISDEQLNSTISEGYKRLYNQYRFSDSREIVRQRLNRHERAFRSTNGVSPGLARPREHQAHPSQNEVVGTGRNEVVSTGRSEVASTGTSGVVSTGRSEGGGEIAAASANPQGLQTHSTSNDELKEYCRNIQSYVSEIKHPEYANIETRLATFSSWPKTHVVKPKELVEAGFYFTGQEDRVRCFVCNGGLCNWDLSDVPLYEHARWYGSCLYIQDCQRHPVAAAIIDTARQIETAQTSSGSPHHHHHQGHTQCDTESMEVRHTDEQERKTEENGAGAQPISTDQDPTSTTKGVDVESMTRQNEELKSSRTCTLCLDAPVGVIFLPCSHLVTCLDCSLQLDKCPLCRAEIKGRARVFI